MKKRQLYLQEKRKKFENDQEEFSGYLGPKEVLEVVAEINDLHLCLEKCKRRNFVEEEFPTLVNFLHSENQNKILIGVFGLRKLSGMGN